MIKVTYQLFNDDDEVIQTYDFFVQDVASVEAINKMMDANSKNRYEYTWNTVK